MLRFVVTARLRRGSFAAVRDILREGPPFELAGTSFERHHVFLGPDELVFLFEGPAADDEVRRLLDDFGVLSRASRIARHFKGQPRVSDEVFSWERPLELEGVSFGPDPGPGDSDGG